MRLPRIMLVPRMRRAGTSKWSTSSQMLLHDSVGAGFLPSAVRLNATARYLGVLVWAASNGFSLMTATYWAE